jgi:arylsulfatase
MQRPNIILIMTDQQRADSIGVLGAPWMKTPHLDRLVTDGAAFSECFVTSPVCVGARASPGSPPGWVRWPTRATTA